LTDREAPAVGGRCPPMSGIVGNGASYQYHVTPVYQTSGTSCGGRTVQAASAVLLERCITSIGTVNGQARRLQELLSAQPGTSLFPFSGILGLNSVSITENGFGDLQGRIASNGKFTLKSCKTSGSASQITYDPGPTGTVANSCGGTIQIASPAQTSNWTLTGLDPFFGNPNTADPANNDNATVFSGRSDFTYTYDPTKGTRSLKDNTNANLVLNGSNPRAGSSGIWTFNLCSLTFTHVTQITLQGGAMARFLIDSSERPESNCSTTGTLSMTGTSAMNYDSTKTPPGDPTALQFLVYGSATVSISNQSGFVAALYAPLADVKFTNKTVWYGALAAQSVTATNGLDFHPGDVSSIVTSTGPSRFYTREGWGECPSGSVDPQSGC
jgi:hypothetical protein